MIESLEELKAIRDGAPDGAEYVSVCGNAYAKFENGVFSQYIHGGWIDISKGNVYSRALSDIKRIIKLMELLE